MLKEKWKKLLLREKVLLISGILVILSIPLSLITLYAIVISMTFFVVAVFYNLYKFVQIADILISETTEMRKEQDESKEDKKVSETIILPLTIGIGMPMILALLVYLWNIAI